MNFYFLPRSNLYPINIDISYVFLVTLWYIEICTHQCVYLCFYMRSVINRTLPLLSVLLYVSRSLDEGSHWSLDLHVNNFYLRFFFLYNICICFLGVQVRHLREVLHQQAQVDGAAGSARQSLLREAPAEGRPRAAHRGLPHQTGPKVGVCECVLDRDR